MIDLVIDRSRWLRGAGSVFSRLLRVSDDKMCCLGFASIAIGFTEDQIRNHNEPRSVIEDANARYGESAKVAEDTFYGSRQRDSATMELMRINDAENLQEEEREELIVGYMKILGFNVTFIDGQESADV